MAVVFAMLLVARFKWFPIFDFSSEGWRSIPPLTPERLTWPLLLAGGFLLLLVLAILRPRQAMLASSLLLVLHVLDVFSLQVELDYMRMPRTSSQVMGLFRTYDYKFCPVRSQDYNSNARFRALAPTLFGAAQPELETRPWASDYRWAICWTLDGFLFFDPGATALRVGYWEKGVDAFHRAWVPADQRDPFRPGLPIPESLAYRKLIGLGFPKLQMFSSIHILPTDATVAGILGSRQFAGDMLLASEVDIIGLGERASPVLKRADKVVPQANDRLPQAKISVEGFTFNTLRLRVNGSPSAPSVLYYPDAWHPNWHSVVNGRPAPVIRTNLGYKSVIVPPGPSEVEFSFGDWRSAWLVRGIQLVAILAFCGVVGLLATFRPFDMLKAPSKVEGQAQGGEHGRTADLRAAQC
jgi:hypothetical protein